VTAAGARLSYSRSHVRGGDRAERRFRNSEGAHHEEPEFGFDSTDATRYNTRYRNVALAHLSAERLYMLYTSGGLDAVRGQLAKQRARGIICRRNHFVSPWPASLATQAEERLPHSVQSALVTLAQVVPLGQSLLVPHAFKH